MMASRTGNVTAIKVLLDSGAQINAKETRRGTTALMWSADQGHAAAVQLLVDRGADVQRPGNPAPTRQETGKRRSWQRPTIPRRSNRALQARAGAADGTAAQQQGRATAEAPDLSGGALTPLVYAARANDLETVKTLLAAGADINQGSGYGWTPLLVATQNRTTSSARSCWSTARIRTRRTRAAGRHSTSRWTTGTSKAATIRSARATWIIWNSSGSCSTRAPT